MTDCVNCNQLMHGSIQHITYKSDICLKIWTPTWLISTEFFHKVIHISLDKQKMDELRDQYGNDNQESGDKNRRNMLERN